MLTQHFNIQHPLRHLVQPKIVVLRSLPGLGDLLCCLPALRALRASFPKAFICLIGLPEASQFVQRFHLYIDDLLIFPGFPGIPEVAFHHEKTSNFIEKIQQLKFDLALQMHGNGRHSNKFILQLGAQLNAGFYPNDNVCSNLNFFFPYPKKEPEVWRHLRLLEFLGIPLKGDHLEFPITNQDWQDWQTIVSTLPLSSPYICIHPGASKIERCWHPKFFAKVADQLAANGWQIVLTGTSQEANLTKAVSEFMRFPAIDLAGCTSLGALAILLKKAHLLICNDTGVSHLAVALQVKSVVIFSNSDPERWAPLNRDRHRVIEACNNNLFFLESNKLINHILDQAKELLKQENIYAR